MYNNVCLDDANIFPIGYVVIVLLINRVNREILHISAWLEKI